ncbi:MAG: FliA/WhiG family RNA polymerase sigma factor [Desulfobacterales bacterium]
MRAGIKKYQEVCPVAMEDADFKGREDLIIKYAPLVKKIAERMAMRLPPQISKEELIGPGILGLFDAIEKFDSTKGIKFKTYANMRIKGAILDELRKMDWISRSVRKNINRIEDAIRALELKLGRSPKDDEIAEEMGIDIESYYKMTSKSCGVNLLSLDELMLDGATPKISKQVSDVPSPFDNLKVKEIKTVIAKALSTLSKKEQLVMSLYYYDELTLKEIANVLDLTESRISQIHSKAIIRLRVKMRTYHEG